MISGMASGEPGWLAWIAAHGHIVCEQCGAMTEVPDELFGDLARVVAARYGFAIAPHRFAVTGLCADCQ